MLSVQLHVAASVSRVATWALLMCVLLTIHTQPAEARQKPATAPSATSTPPVQINVNDSDTVIVRFPPPERISGIERYQDLIAALLTAVLGLGVLAIWEGVFLPVRTRRRVARALIAE